MAWARSTAFALPCRTFAAELAGTFEDESVVVGIAAAAEGTFRTFLWAA